MAIDQGSWELAQQFKESYVWNDTATHDVLGRAFCLAKFAYSYKEASNRLPDERECAEVDLTRNF